MPEGQTAQNAGRLEFAQSGSEHVRAQSEVALQIAVALRSFEKPLDYEQGPPCADYIEGRGHVAHVVESVSVFIQNGE